ncbi:MAG: hypothetical protein DHS20C02_08980 [Micavibrio sp.]|nr:MAG: hypothetical protein DHS20C02_08980 [Micavibrio sp.]
MDKSVPPYYNHPTYEFMLSVIDGTQESQGSLSWQERKAAWPALRAEFSDMIKHKAKEKIHRRSRTLLLLDLH